MRSAYHVAPPEGTTWPPPAGPRGSRLLRYGFGDLAARARSIFYSLSTAIKIAGRNFYYRAQKSAYCLSCRTEQQLRETAFNNLC